MNRNKSPYYSYFAYLTVVFFNTFVDLGHKVLIQDIFYQTCTPKMYTIMSALVNSFILLPYIFMFTPSGFIADRFSKTTVLRVTAIAAIPLTILITWFYYLGFFWAAFFMTLLLAVQSTLNSPAKYGYIKELFGKEKLAEINGYVQTIIIVSILISTFIFSALFQHILQPYLTKPNFIATPSSIIQVIAPVGFILIICSCAEALCTFFLKYHPAADPTTTFSYKKYIRSEYIKQNLATVYSNQTIFTCILALSVFWGINQVILANYGAYLKEYVQNAGVLYAQGSLALGGLGVLCGAAYTGRKSGGYIETGFIPLASIGMVLGLFFMPMLTNKILIVLLFFAYGFFGGMLVVPLNALIQFHAPDNKLGRILAANNFSQNIFMLLFLVVTAFTAYINFDSVTLFRILLAVAIIGSIYAVWRLPQALIRYVVLETVAKFYRIDSIGINNIPSTGPILLLGNHVSYMDWAIIQITCPRKIRFVLERTIYNKWYINWFCKLFKLIPISAEGSKDSITAIRKALQNGDVVALFPEGFMSRNGQLGEFRRGYELAARDTATVIIPFYIRGLWGSLTSSATRHYRKTSKRLIRHVTICYGKPLANDITPSKLKQAVFQLSLTAWDYYAQHLPTIPAAILHRLKQQKRAVVAIDYNGRKFTGNQLIAEFIAMRNWLCSRIDHAESKIAILLPTGVHGVLINSAALALGKIVINLDHTANADELQQIITSEKIKTIVTTNIFLQKMAACELVTTTLATNCKIIYLDKKNVTSRMLTYLTDIIPFGILRKFFIAKNNTANIAIIYYHKQTIPTQNNLTPENIFRLTLSHKNILSNAKQIASISMLQTDDMVLNNLPLSHPASLTISSFMPLIEGVTVVFHAEPTDTLNIAKIIAKHQITFWCNTPDYLNSYVETAKVHPLLLKSLRLAIAAVDNLPVDIAANFYQKFGINILASFGLDTFAAIITLNLPDVLIPYYWHVQLGSKPRSSGMPLPGTSVEQLCTSDTISYITVAGPQINQQNSDQIYITNHRGYLDEAGYLFLEKQIESYCVTL